MKAYKGCVNPDCEAREQKIHFREEDRFCPKCGCELVYVCKKCHTVLQDGSKNRCARCEAERKVNLQKAKEIGSAVVGTVAVVGVAAAGMFATADSE